MSIIVILEGGTARRQPPTSGASLYTTITNIMCLSHDSGTHIHTTHGSSRTVLLGTQVGVMIAIKTNRVLSKQVQHF